MLNWCSASKTVEHRLKNSRGMRRFRSIDRLRDAQSSGSATIDALTEALQADIKVKEGRRLSSMRRAVALMTGAGLAEGLKNEVDIQLSKAELQALNRIRGTEVPGAEVPDAAADFEDKRVRLFGPMRPI